MSFKRTRLKSALPQKVTLTAKFKGAKTSNGEVDSKTNQETDANEKEAEDLQVRAALNPNGVRLRSTGQRTNISKRRLRRRTTPLEVLQQPFQAGVRKVFDLRRLIIVLALTGVVLLVPLPETLSIEGHRALALFVFTGVILALGPAPLPIAALLVPICQIALGIDTVDGAFAPFSKPVVFLILGSLFLAEALRKHGLTRRLALYAIVQSGGSFPLLLLELMLITSMLSMWVLNTATAAILIPVAITIAQRVKRPDEAQKVLSILILGIAYSSSLGAIATIMGSGENAIASGLLNDIQPFGFISWMQYGLPVVIVLVPFSWLLLKLTFRLPKIEIDTLPALREIRRLGTLSSAERKIILTLFTAVMLWISGKWLEEMLILPPSLLSSAVVAIGAVALLSVEEVIDWNDLRGVNWGVFFVIGAGLTLGDALHKTGADAWFAGLLAPQLEGLPYVLILTILVSIAFVLTQFMNNVTLGAILAPILITLGEASGIVPARLLLPTVFALALAYMLPAASARMTLVSVTGTVKRTDMIRAGLIVGIPSAMLIWAFFYMLSRAEWI